MCAALVGEAAPLLLNKTHSAHVPPLAVAAAHWRIVCSRPALIGAVRIATSTRLRPGARNRELPAWVCAAPTHGGTTQDATDTPADYRMTSH